MIYNNILVTGGAGFIGANFIHYIFKQADFTGNVINIDKLTYAGNIDNLTEIEQKYGQQRYFFEHADICNLENLNVIFEKYQIDAVCHFAAESHVDRSIYGPEEFIQTNIIGTFNLLEASRKQWEGKSNVRFHHVSTDEVYGSLGDTGHFFETTPYDPRSPYSASKASSDHLVRAYFHTYDLPVTISNCSNNYGPYQFPEKVIPVMILNAIDGKPLPVYGEGKNIRDWLYVEDHNSAVWKIITEGKTGETYNIGGECEKQNIELVRTICSLLDQIKPRDDNKKYEELITFVKDRPGHDLRYAINCDKIKHELGWTQTVTFEEGLKQTIEWYLGNMEWIDNIRTGDYQQWINKNYVSRT